MAFLPQSLPANAPVKSQKVNAGRGENEDSVLWRGSGLRPSKEIEGVQVHGT